MKSRLTGDMKLFENKVGFSILLSNLEIFLPSPPPPPPPPTPTTTTSKVSPALSTSQLDNWGRRLMLVKLVSLELGIKAVLVSIKGKQTTLCCVEVEGLQSQQILFLKFGHCPREVSLN
nr:hypothetical protein CFP56_64360 [Quercus suber]